MATEPAMSGEIPPDGVLEILREVESRRVTGRLRFTAISESGAQQTGEVELVGGQIALDQDPLPDGKDPVERLLALRGGIYVVHQQLPPLPVSHGDESSKTGSLAVHLPADLMNYCEQAGLTGTLTLERGGEGFELVYECGDLLAIRIDGKEADDLSHVFGWEEGTFRIAVNSKALTLVPALEPPPHQAPLEDEDPGAREPTTQFVRQRSDDTGKHFLKVFEVALTDIVDQRDAARAKAREKRAASGEKVPSVRPRPPSMPAPPRRKREPTVRVVYLTPDDPSTAVPSSDARSTRHASGKNVASEAGAAKKVERSVETKKAAPDPQPAKRTEARGQDKASEPRAVNKTSEPRAEKPAKSKAQAEPDRDRRTPARAHPPPPPVSSGLGPIAWVVAFIAVGVLILVLITQLPSP